MRNVVFALVSLLCLVTNTEIYCQTLQDVVYLKNGSIIRGVIIEQIPNESLKIQTGEGSVFVYRMDEVVKTTTEQAPSASYDQPSPSGAQLGLLVGYGTEEWYNLGFGGRVGRTFGNVYLGGVFVYHLGKSETGSVSGYQFEVTVNTLYAGPEIGYEGRVGGHTTIRPYVAFGYMALMASVEVSGSGINQSDSERRFFVAPALLMSFAVSPKSRLGIDARYVVVSREQGSEPSAFGIFGTVIFQL